MSPVPFSRGTLLTKWFLIISRALEAEPITASASCLTLSFLGPHSIVAQQPESLLKIMLNHAIPLLRIHLWLSSLPAAQNPSRTALYLPPQPCLVTPGLSPSVFHPLHEHIEWLLSSDSSLPTPLQSPKMQPARSLQGSALCFPRFLPNPQDVVKWPTLCCPGTNSPF